MRRWLVSGALCIGGCVDKNPEFVDTMPAGETGMQTSAPPATDSAATDGPATTAPVTTTTTTTTTGTESGDTEDTLEPTGYPVTTEPMSTTMPPGGCGDGKVNPNEECDDGNPDEDDGCLTTCVKAICGDGFVQSEVDACDDGNDEESDECPKDCAVAFCGDGFLKFDEDCDDGNFSDNDGCEKDCRPTVRFIFVTSKLFTGAMGGLAGADKACNDLAEGMLPGTYKAWLSINMDYPAQRMTHSLHPYVRSDGAMIAKNWDGLVSGALLGPIDYTEEMVKSKGAAPNLACPMPMVHTNTNASGMPYSEGTDCLGWMSQIGVSKAGSLGQIDEDWTESCYGDTCKFDAPIYCVQQ